MCGTLRGNRTLPLHCGEKLLFMLILSEENTLLVQNWNYSYHYISRFYWCWHTRTKPTNKYCKLLKEQHFLFCRTADCVSVCFSSVRALATPQLERLYCARYVAYYGMQISAQRPIANGKNQQKQKTFTGDSQSRTEWNRFAQITMLFTFMLNEQKRKV